MFWARPGPMSHVPAIRRDFGGACECAGQIPVLGV